MSATAYWQSIKALRESLPDVFFVTTASNGDCGRVAGVVSEVSNGLVCQHLHEGTLRLSTPDEIERYKAEQERRRAVAGVRSDGAAGRFRFTESEAGVRSEAATVGPVKSKAGASR